METLSTDLFFYLIPYVDFDDVIPLCSVNKKFQRYGTQYPDRWKPLIDQTYSFVYNYSVENYNYITYGYFIRDVDPVSRLMIHLRRGNSKVAKKDQALLNLANCLLKRDPIYSNTLSLPLGSLLEGAKQFAKYGNMNGMLQMLAMVDFPVMITSEQGVLTYAREGYADVLQYTFDPSNRWNVQALELACLYGRLKIVKFLVQNHIMISEAAFVNACIKNHLKIVIYLSEMSPINRPHQDEGFRTACASGSLSIVKYLLPKVSELTIKEGFVTACNFGHIVILDCLKDYVDVPTLREEIIPILEVFPAESMNHVIAYLNSFQ